MTEQVPLNPGFSQHCLVQMTHVPEEYAKEVAAYQNAEQRRVALYKQFKEMIWNASDSKEVHETVEKLRDVTKEVLEHAGNIVQRYAQFTWNANGPNIYSGLTKATSYDVAIAPARLIGRALVRQPSMLHITSSAVQEAGVKILQAVNEKL